MSGGEESRQRSGDSGAAWQYKSLAEKLIARHAELKTMRRPFEGLWQDIVTYLLPEFYDLLGGKEKGQKTGLDIYDGSPIGMLQLLADGLHGYLVSPSLQWFRLMMADERLMTVRSIKTWLEAAERGLYAAFKRSNFYEAMSQYFYVGAGLGTPVMWIEEDIYNGRLVFDVLHPREYYIAQDQFGYVDTVHREFKMSGRNMAERFGFKQLGHKVQNDLNQGRMDNKYPVIHTVWPNTDRNVLSATPENKRFASVYIDPAYDKGLQETGILKASGYDNKPMACWRWRQLPGEVYGRCPGSQALVDIMGLNQFGRTLTVAAQMAAEPPLNVPSSMEGSVKIIPFGQNFYEDPASIITPLDLHRQFPIAIDREDKKRQIIEDHFRVDFFLMLQRAERAMTATEVIEKSGEKAAVLGATIGRFVSEAMDPIIDTALDHELRAGRIPPPPDELIEHMLTTGQANINVDYMGPLAQAQRRLFRTQGILRSLEITGPLMEMRPDLGDRINWDALVVDLLEQNGMPQKLIQSDEVVQMIQEQRAKQIQQQQAMAGMESAAGSIEKFAKADQLAEGAISEGLSRVIQQ